EGVGLDDVGAGAQVGFVDRLDDLGPRQLEQVAVALEALRMVLEALAAVVGLAELVALDHRAHRAVEDDDPFLEDLRQGGGARVRLALHSADCRKPLESTRPQGPRRQAASAARRPLWRDRENRGIRARAGRRLPSPRPRARAATSAARTESPAARGSRTSAGSGAALQ